jgi:hypothetical protein
MGLGGDIGKWVKGENKKLKNGGGGVKRRQINL